MKTKPSTQAATMTTTQAADWLKKNRHFIKVKSFEGLLHMPTNSMYRIFKGKAEITEDQAELLRIMIAAMQAALYAGAEEVLFGWGYLFSIRKIETEIGITPFYLSKCIGQGNKRIPSEENNAKLYTWFNNILKF